MVIITDYVDASQAPDGALISWLDEEEHSFRLLERHKVAERLQQGFGEHGDDVDEFIKFSLGVQNRRKSRAGHSFETGKQTPDFMFPGQDAYYNQNFPDSQLRMLRAKTSCKERWRQVLAEAKRIERKHLITLEPAISEDQTNQMQEMNLQLVVPKVIQSTYTTYQKEYLISFAEFISEIRRVSG